MPEELDASAALVVSCGVRAGGYLQGGEQCPRAVLRVGVAVTDQRAAIGQLQITLLTFQCLDARLLVDRQNDRLVGWIEMQLDDLGRLAAKCRIRAFAQ